jgi:hypothetical protein
MSMEKVQILTIDERQRLLAARKPCSVHEAVVAPPPLPRYPR